MNKKYSRDKVISLITDVTIRSVNSDEVLILEIGNLNNFLPQNQAEKIRQKFVAHKTPIMQITNQPQFNAWTNTENLAQNMEVSTYLTPISYPIG